METPQNHFQIFRPINHFSIQNFVGTRYNHIVNTPELHNAGIPPKCFLLQMLHLVAAVSCADRFNGIT